MIELYTLPTCPICEMVKKKLKAKGLIYNNKAFEDLPDYIKKETDHAPVLYTGEVYLYSPTSINEWIKEV